MEAVSQLAMSSMTPFSTWYKGDKFQEFVKQYGQPISPTNEPQMFWLDLETTGLDSIGDPILEIGLILTDRFGNLIQDGAARWLVLDPHDWHTMHRIHTMSDKVREMHAMSGLLECLGHAMKSPRGLEISPGKVQNSVLGWLRQMLGDRDFDLHSGLAYPSGSTVHFDRAHIKVQMPFLHEWFHYRNGADVSSFRHILSFFNKSFAENQPKARKLHRVMPDLLDSIELYRYEIKTGLIAPREAVNAAA